MIYVVLFLLWLILLIFLIEIVEYEEGNYDHCQKEYYQFHFTAKTQSGRDRASVARKQLIDSICAALNILDKIVNVNISQLSFVEFHSIT